MKEYFKKRKGWGDSKDGYDKKEYKPQAADQKISGREYGKRKGWGDKESVKKYGGAKGQGYPKGAKYAERSGWDDSGDGGYQYDGKKLKYEDGGVVKNPKMEALLALRSQMEQLGGPDLNEAPRYEDGGVVESHSEDESSIDLDELSREELIRLLKK